MMTRKQLSKACLKAADVIERDGLLKGDYGTAAGPKCAVGAVRFAASGSTAKLLDLETDVLDLNTLFKETRPRSHRGGVTFFNDATRTRKHDVVKLLRDMAAKAAS